MACRRSLMAVDFSMTHHRSPSRLNLARTMELDPQRLSLPQSLHREKTVKICLTAISTHQQVLSRTNRAAKYLVQMLILSVSRSLAFQEISLQRSQISQLCRRATLMQSSTLYTQIWQRPTRSDETLGRSLSKELMKLDIDI